MEKRENRRKEGQVTKVPPWLWWLHTSHQRKKKAQSPLAHGKEREKKKTFSQAVQPKAQQTRPNNHLSRQIGWAKGSTLKKFEKTEHQSSCSTQKKPWWQIKPEQQKKISPGQLSKTYWIATEGKLNYWVRREKKKRKRRKEGKVTEALLWLWWQHASNQKEDLTKTNSTTPKNIIRTRAKTSSRSGTCSHVGVYNTGAS